MKCIVYINTRGHQGHDVQVVVGAGDPNPLVGGAGIQTLEQAGIEVEMIGGEEEQIAYDLNKEFMERMKAAGKKG